MFQGSIFAFLSYLPLSISQQNCRKFSEKMEILNFWSHFSHLMLNKIKLYKVIIKSGWPITAALIADLLVFTTRRGVLVSCGFCFVFFCFFFVLLTARAFSLEALHWRAWYCFTHHSDIIHRSFIQHSFATEEKSEYLSYVTGALVSTRYC